MGSLSILRIDRNQQITDAGIAHLKSLPNLEELVLVGCSVTDDGLRYLSGLRSVKRLNLRVTYVTDEGLKHLKELPALEKLDLYPIGASGSG
jgi:internalin A